MDSEWSVYKVIFPDLLFACCYDFVPFAAAADGAVYVLKGTAPIFRKGKRSREGAIYQINSSSIHLSVF